MSECVLCGVTSKDVKHRLLRWRDGSFDAAPRCEDRAACRARVQAAGEEWPVADAPEKKR